jgi:hypothetical protein
MRERLENMCNTADAEKIQISLDVIINSFLYLITTNFLLITEQLKLKLSSQSRDFHVNMISISL